MGKKELEYFVDDISLMGVDEKEFGLIKDRADIRVKAILPYIRGKDVLDIGCGSGYATDKYQVVAKNIMGLDIDEEAISFAVEHYPETNFMKGDMLDAFPKTYDVIIATETLEHVLVADWDKILKNVSSALNEGGIFLGTIPVEGYTESWDSHKARYNMDVFKTKFSSYFGEGLVTQLTFPWYYPSYFFRFIKEEKNG